MNKDLKTIIRPLNALDLTSVVAPATVVGEIIDTQDYQGVAFVPRVDNKLAGTYLPLIEDGELPALGDAAAVDDDFLVNTEALCGAELAADGISWIGYIGKKRYVRLSLVCASTPTGDVSADAIMGWPQHAPTV
jgi:hypothetical protein